MPQTRRVRNPIPSTLDDVEDRALWAALTPQQAQFLLLYSVSHDPGSAYRQAYHPAAEPSLKHHYAGLDVLRSPRIKRGLASLYRRRQAVIEIDRARVALELARMTVVDLRKFYHPDGRLRMLDELDEDTAAALQSIEVVETEKFGMTRKVKVHDKVGAARELSTLMGWRVQKTEDVSRGGTLVIEGLHDPDPDDPLYS